MPTAPGPRPLLGWRPLLWLLVAVLLAADAPRTHTTRAIVGPTPALLTPRLAADARADGTRRGAAAAPWNAAGTEPPWGAAVDRWDGTDAREAAEAPKGRINATEPVNGWTLRELWRELAQVQADPQPAAVLAYLERLRHYQWWGAKLPPRGWKVAQRLFARAVDAARGPARDMTAVELMALVDHLLALILTHPYFRKTLEKTGLTLMKVLVYRFNYAPLMLQLSGPEVARLIWSFGKFSVRRPKFFPVAAWRLRQQDTLASLEPRELAMAIHGLARARAADDATLAAVALQVRRRITGFGPQEVANVAWAYAALGVRNTQLMDTVASAILQPGFVEQFTPQAIANVGWAYGTLGIMQRSVMAELAQQLRQPEVLQRCQPQNIANFVWAIAKLRLRDEETLAAVADHLRHRRVLKRFEPQSLANVLWAVATLRYRHEPLMQTVALRLVRGDFLERFGQQELANTAWAFARLECGSDAVLDAIARRAQQRDLLLRLLPQNVAILAWAFAKLAVPNRELMAGLARRMRTEGVEDFKLFELSLAVWAFAKLNVRDEGLMGVVSDHLLQGDVIDQLHWREISHVAYAFGKLGVNDTQLMAALAARALKPEVLSGFGPYGLSTTSWAFARLNLRHEPLMAGFAQRLLQPGGLDQCQGHSLANLAQAFVRLAAADERVMRAIAARAAAPSYLATAPTECLVRVAVACAEVGVKDDGLLAEVARQLRTDEGIQRVSPVLLADLAGAYARLGEGDPALLGDIAADLAEPDSLRYLQPRDVADLVAAYAALGLRHSRLLRTAGDALAPPAALAALDAPQLATALWAFAALAAPRPALLAASAARLRDDDGGFLATLDGRGLATVGWALAALDVRDDEALYNVLVASVAQWSRDLAEAALLALNVHVLLHARELPWCHQFLARQPDYVAACQRQAAAHAAASPAATPRRLLAQALQAMGRAARPSAPLPDAGGLVAPVLLPDARAVLLISDEAAGYTAAGQWRPTAAIQLLGRQLEGFGYHVAAVSLGEMQAMSLPERQAYLADRLNRTTVASGGPADG